MYYLLVDYKIEVIKTKHQNKVSKNYKVQQKTGSREDKPDLIFHTYLC